LDLIDENIEYVCFLDSDDRLLPGKLSREITLLKENSNADFTYSSSIIFEEEVQEESEWKVAAAGCPERFAIEHFLTNEAKCSAMLYRAHVMKNRRFREDLTHNEDSEFLQRIAIECKGIYSSQPGCWVRSHPGSKSRNLIAIHKAVLQSSIEILESYPAFYRSYSALADQRIRQVRRSLFVELVLKKQWDEARGYAKSFVEKFILSCRLHTYYRFRRFAGSVLRKWS
jgi:glycosyltransferase involved in cell wall biosynthesis